MAQRGRLIHLPRRNRYTATMITLTALNIYPVKSCRGIALDRATITGTGLAHDREWLITRPNGHFVTQREEPRLALITPTLTNDALILNSAKAGTLEVPFAAQGAAVQVKCWSDHCAAFDTGDRAAAWLEAHLGKPHRLVRFDPEQRRLASPDWTQGIEAPTQFSDEFQFLVISQASLDDLNGRLPNPLPMNRFRPNLVVDGLEPYGEDQLHEIGAGQFCLRVAKPCIRCIITTTDQDTAQRDPAEPIKTLRGYRFNKAMRGVMFGQNCVLVRGIGQELRVGDQFQVTRKSQDSDTPTL